MTFPFVRFGALILAAGLVLAADGAFAQATTTVAQAAPSPAPTAAAPAPAAAARPTGPVKLDLIPMQAPWTKICGKDQGSGKEVCYTTRDFGQAADQPPTLAIAVYQMANEERRIARFLLPVGLLLKPGFRLVIDKGEPIDGKFAICFPNGCFAEAELNDADAGRPEEGADRQRDRAQPGQYRSHLQFADEGFRNGVRRAGGRSEGARAAEPGVAEAARGKGAPAT